MTIVPPTDREIEDNIRQVLYGRKKLTDVEFPQQSTYQLKIEDTAKGIRITVHVYATGIDTCVTDTFRLYETAKNTATEKGILVAPMSVGEEKK